MTKADPKRIRFLSIIAMLCVASVDFLLKETESTLLFVQVGKVG